jgi:Group II intron, maturase-specific domain
VVERPGYEAGWNNWPVGSEIWERTTGRHASDDLTHVVKWDLNPVLRGWANYYRVGNSSRKFGIVD